MMFEKEIPVEFWAEDVNIAVYLQDRCSTSVVAGKTPFEVFTGSKPGIEHLRVFGCICFIHIPSALRQKLDSKAENWDVYGIWKL